MRELPFDAVTKKRKTILGAFGLADTDVLNSAAEISRLLGNNCSLLTDIDVGNAHIKSGIRMK